MGFSVAQTYLSDILHVVSQALLAPDIILLLVFIGYALFSIGSVIVEYFTVRKHFKVVMPKFLAALTEASEENIPQVIDESGLLNRQKDALNTVYEYRTLPGDALVALVRRLVSEEETRYDRITGRNNMAAKVAPMLGLMGTLIPLGPGIQALGNADTAALSSSLLVAFDTTVAGLVTAAVCLIVGKIRSSWYENYLSALDASMATMLEKIEGNRDASTTPNQVQEPADDAAYDPSPKPLPALEQQQSMAEQQQPTFEEPQSNAEAPAFEQPEFEGSSFEQPQPVAEQPAIEQLPAFEQSQPAVEQQSTLAQQVVDPLETPVDTPTKDAFQFNAEAQPIEPQQAEPRQDTSSGRVLFGARPSREKGSSDDSSSDQG